MCASRVSGGLLCLAAAELDAEALGCGRSISESWAAEYPMEQHWHRSLPEIAQYRTIRKGARRLDEVGYYAPGQVFDPDYASGFGGSDRNTGLHIVQVDPRYCEVFVADGVCPYAIGGRARGGSTRARSRHCSRRLRRSPRGRSGALVDAHRVAEVRGAVEEVYRVDPL